MIKRLVAELCCIERLGALVCYGSNASRSRYHMGPTKTRRAFRATRKPCANQLVCASA